MTRKQALETIRIEVAKHGIVTREALRVYIEHRISRQVFNETVSRGMATYRRLNPPTPAR